MSERVGSAIRVHEETSERAPSGPAPKAQERD
jgi:hypothetical protein